MGSPEAEVAPEEERGCAGRRAGAGCGCVFGLQGVSRVLPGAEAGEQRQLSGQSHGVTPSTVST